MPERTLAVIDGNSLLHRAFHALPVTMTAPDGRPTNAAYGFISMLLKLTESFRPDALDRRVRQGAARVPHRGARALQGAPAADARRAAAAVRHRRRSSSPR